MISVQNKKKLSFLLFLTAVILFFFFRLKNHQYMSSYTDNAYEIEIARTIVDKKEMPLVGPKLTANNFNIPPTYPYIIALFYKISGGDVFKIGYCFIFLNLIAVICATIFFYKETKNILLSSLLSLTLVSMNIWVRESTIIWHPHPTTAFTFIALLLLKIAKEKDRIFILFLGLLSYFIALSIYPSPIFILFTIIGLIKNFFHKKHSRKKTIFISLSLVIIAAIIVYFPQIIYEIKNNFPIITAIVEKETTAINEQKNFYKSIEDVFLVIKSSLFIKNITLLIIVGFIITSNIFFKKKTMISLPSIIFIIIISTLFIPGKAWGHRFTFITIAIVYSLFEILNESLKNKSIFFILISSFSIFLILKNNIRVSYDYANYINYPETWKNVILISEKIDQIIIEEDLDRDQSYIYTPSGELTENKDIWKYKWKWYSNIYNTLINKKYNKNPQLDENLKNFANKNYEMQYPGNFLLICKDIQKSCFENFVKTINQYHQNKEYSSLILKKEFETNLENKTFTKIYLFEAK